MTIIQTIKLHNICSTTLSITQQGGAFIFLNISQKQGTQNMYRGILVHFGI